MGNIFSQSFWTEVTHDWDSHQAAPDCPYRPPIRQWCIYSALLEFKGYRVYCDFAVAKSNSCE